MECTLTALRPDAYEGQKVGEEHRLRRTRLGRVYYKSPAEREPESACTCRSGTVRRNLPRFVDLLLTRRAHMQKPRCWAGRMSLIILRILVAGVGFEPTTFRL